MSSIVLSAAVRQNLLSLQQTAGLMAQTQNNLSTGNKVNSALDNPTNFFTAQGLNNRGSDISNLLDGISNGIQVIQAANTGITSVQSLVSQAKSIANQALQTSIGYSQKASIISAAITDASGNAITASDLRGTGTATAATLTGTAVNTATATNPMTSTSLLSALGMTSGTAINFKGGASGSTSVINITSSGSNTATNLNINTATVGDFLSALNATASGSWSVSGGRIQFTANGGNDTISDNTGTPLSKILGNTGSTYTTNQSFALETVTTAGSPIVGTSALANLASAITTSDTLTVNGSTISFTNSGSNSYSATGATLNISSGATVQNLLTAIDTITGTSNASTIASGAITLNGLIGSTISLTGSALNKLGLSATSGNGATATATGSGNTLTIASVAGGTATSITFGDGTGGTVKTLDQLNSALSANNLQATLSTTGQLTISTTNDNASASIGTIGGTAFSSASGAFYNKTVSAPVADATSQATRTNLVNQYNALLTQIDQTSADASFNGVNLLAGDQLQLTFNETGKSKLSITGVNFSSAGLGLSSLASTAFKDNASTNATLATLNTVTSTLRSQASALGSNLSIVQTRQDFNKNLINVLQTGSANLTQADINLEAANSQALSTRQSLSVSALSLANQSQQNVLQLLR